MWTTFKHLSCVTYLCLLIGCSSVPNDTNAVTFTTSSPIWFEDIQTAKKHRGKAHLHIPEGSGPHPAVIVLHTSLGLGESEKHFKEVAQAQGFAVALVDSFTPRGIHKIDDNQAEISEVSILSDLYAVKALLEQNPKIDKNAIGVVGFSKGALPAFYSNLQYVHNLYAKGTKPFAAHVAFYPWCGLTLQKLETNKKPVQVHVGALDTITPPDLCRRLIAKIQKQDTRAAIEMHVYENARHAFEHPILKNLPRLPVGYAVPKDCRIVERPDGKFLETSQKLEINSDTFEQVISGCSEKGASVSGNKAAAELAYARVFKFLDQHMKR
ncbi:MAG: dienelactone hydrolase family protein [Pseudomonadota bacterium]